MKTPSSSFPGWVMGLCPFQGMAGCDRVPVSLSLTSLLLKQPGGPAQDRFSGTNGCSVDLKIKLRQGGIPECEDASRTEMILWRSVGEGGPFPVLPAPCPRLSHHWMLAHSSVLEMPLVALSPGSQLGRVNMLYMLHSWIFIFSKHVSALGIIVFPYSSICSCVCFLFQQILGP